MSGRAELTQSLRQAGVVDVDDSDLSRTVYSADASLYRVPPLVVVRPRSADEVSATLEIARTSGTALTSRGGGTSIAGNAIGPGVILDFSRHLNRILKIDPETRTATVEPGVVLSKLQRAIAPHGLRFGPDPSTHNRATIGGMIGNNACGTRALAYGRTLENVRAIELLAGTGTRHLLDGVDRRGLGELDRITRENLDPIRTEFGRFGRQVSGYALEQLLPERGFDVRRAVVGSEGTLGVVLSATLDLVPVPAATVLVVLGYPNIAAAGDAVPALLPHGPIACEGMDARIVEIVRRRGDAVPDLPRGQAWLLIEVGGANVGEAASAAAALVGDGGSIDSRILTDPGQAAAMWRIREDGAGLASRTESGEFAYPGWEDAAVPPERLGAYLRDFESLLGSYRFTGLPYGHFGDGCLHIRIDFPLNRPGGIEVMHEFLFAAADLVVGYGGSLSGEHGDGRARSELLPRMYSAAAMRAMGQVKAFFDPAGVLNPGVVVEPTQLTANLRSQVNSIDLRLGFGYPDDQGDFGRAVHRCNGVGKCRSTDGGSMCPSFRATENEADSTRGRARVLQEVASGRISWGASEVIEALDLCLGCKACASECPTGTDLATYRSEVLHQQYLGRVRPMSHYTLGRLPSWLTLASYGPRLANRMINALPVLRESLGGIDRRRRLPPLASATFRRQFATRRDPGGSGTPVMIFVDPFTDHFAPQVGMAAVRVLEAAGYSVRLSGPDARCAVTLISTGQLIRARKVVRRTVAALYESAAAGIRIVGLEPSSTAVLRSDALDLVPGTETQVVAGAVTTLAELLSATPGWTPPDLSGISVIAQPHCHHEAVMRWSSDAALLGRAGASVKRLVGCCGLAGNWGLAPEHHDVSVAIGELALLPALRDQPQAIVLADGFSCRTQIADLADRPSLHLAELLER